MYIKIENGSPVKVSHYELTLAHPEVSFPRNPSDDTLAEFGLERLHETDRPDGEVVTEVAPVRSAEGLWVRAYEVRSRTAEEKRKSMRCTPRQARLALLQSGKLGQVKQAMAQATEADQIEWDHSTEFVRTHGPLVNMAATIGLTEAEVDALFELAVTL